MHKLMEYVCGELEDLEKKVSKNGGLTPAEIEYADKLAHLKKNLLKTEEMSAEKDEYSNAMRGGSYRGGSYARGGSYEGSYDGSYEGGSYARGRGRNARRDSMGRYSSERGYSRDGEELTEKLRDLMADAPDEGSRQEIERLVRKMEQM